MGSRQDAALEELRAHGGAMWQDGMAAVRRDGDPRNNMYTRSLRGLEKAGVIRRTRVSVGGGTRFRTWVEIAVEGVPPSMPSRIAHEGEVPLDTPPDTDALYEGGRS